MTDTTKEAFASTVNNNYDFSKFKARCSAIHCVVANSQSNPCLTDKMAKELSDLESKDVHTEVQKQRIAELLVRKDNGSKVILSDGYISYLMEEYAWKTQRMIKVTKDLMDVSQMRKGVLVEADSLILLSNVDKVAYKPNVKEDGTRERICNEYLSGEVDAYAGKSLMEAEVIPDVKSIWDYPTFLCKIHDKVTLANDWQIKGYMDISGATQGFVANCLITTPDAVAENIKYRLLNKMNVATEESPEFKENWALLKHSMTFDHIPEHKRLFKKSVEPITDEKREFLYDRVKIGRDWLCEFHEKYKSFNH
jgi:hypothetical protein